MNTNVDQSSIGSSYLTPQQSMAVFFPEDEIPVATRFIMLQIKEGVCFMVSGIMLRVCESFSIHINCSNPEHDIALRINVRMLQRFIYRNTRIKYKWGVPECGSLYPLNLKHDRRFFIQVVITEPKYLIALNGVHFASYNHRTNYRSLLHVQVFGDVKHVYINHYEVQVYPGTLGGVTKSPEMIPKLESRHDPVPKYSFGHDDSDLFIPIPYYAILPPNAMTDGIHLRLQGRVKLLPSTFFVNLQSDHNFWPHPTVALSVGCSFGIHRDFVRRNVLSSNAYINNQWGQEEITKLGADILPGKTFSLIIIQSATSYQVFVGRRLICEFKFRVSPDVVKTVVVLGDIKLWRIGLEEHRPRDFVIRKPRKSIAEFLRRIDTLNRVASSRHSIIS